MKILSVRLKTKVQNIFHFVNMNESLKDLIKFVGKPPVIQADLSLKYKKHVIKDNSYIFLSESGEIMKVIGSEEFNNSYEIVNTLTKDVETQTPKK